MPGKRLEDLRLPPDASRAVMEVREQMRALAHGTSRNSLAGIPLASGIGMVIEGATDSERRTVAEVLASELNLDVYRLDLGAVVSSYIGETEKNLDRVFAMAEKAGAILVFDEADALFGKRTEVKDAHDRYANLEVSYLLQRIESYKGLVVVSVNAKESIDAAFLRRLRYVVRLPLPGGDRLGVDERRNAQN